MRFLKKGFSIPNLYGGRPPFELSDRIAHHRRWAVLVSAGAALASVGLFALFVTVLGSLGSTGLSLGDTLHGLALGLPGGAVLSLGMSLLRAERNHRRHRDSPECIAAARHLDDVVRRGGVRRPRMGLEQGANGNARVLDLFWVCYIQIAPAYMAQLTDRQQHAVLAHEVAHIVNHDVRLLPLRLLIRTQPVFVALFLVMGGLGEIALTGGLTWPLPALAALCGGGGLLLSHFALKAVYHHVEMSADLRAVLLGADPVALRGALLDNDPDMTRLADRVHALRRDTGIASSNSTFLARINALEDLMPAPADKAA